MLVLAAVAAALVPWPPSLVERWVALYHRWQPAVTAASNLVPFAVLDALIAGAAIAVAATWAKHLRRAERGRRLSAAGAALGSTATLFAVLLLWFLAGWGLHYRQLPVERRFDIERSRVDAAAVERLAGRAVGELNRLVTEARAHETSTLAELALKLRPAFAATLPDVGIAVPVEAGLPKKTMLAPFFRWASIAGLTDPFFLEVMVTPEALPLERPAILAHEWSHLAGFARESEASFVAFLACQRGDPATQYSGWFDLFVRARAQLAPEARAAVDARVSAAVRADIRAVAERLRRAVPAVRDAAWRGYDTYLRTQRVERGLADYDEVVMLVAGARFNPGWVPRPRRQ